jgi:hypothetical protein
MQRNPEREIRRAESFSKPAAIFNPRNNYPPIFDAMAASCMSIQSESYNV